MRSIRWPLARRMYVKKARIALEFTPEERAEVDRLLARAMTEPPSGALLRTAAPKTKKRLCCRPGIKSQPVEQPGLSLDLGGRASNACKDRTGR